MSQGQGPSGRENKRLVKHGKHGLRGSAVLRVAWTFEAVPHSHWAGEPKCKHCGEPKYVHSCLDDRWFALHYCSFELESAPLARSEEVGRVGEGGARHPSMPTCHNCGMPI